MEIAEVLRKLKPLWGEKRVTQTWRDLQVLDPETRKLLEAQLRLDLQRLVGSSFEEQQLLLEPPPTTSAAGEFAFGTVQYGTRALHAFGLRADELLQHLAIFGRTGAGKTNVAFLLLRELTRAGIPWLVADWKRNYRDLLSIPEFEQVVVYTVGRDLAPFCFNPLVPPAGVDVREHVKMTADLLGSAYYLGEGVAFVIQEVLEQAYQEAGSFAGSGKWPTFRDAFEILKQRKATGRAKEWMQSAHRALGVLTYGAMDKVVNGAHLPLDQLLSQFAVLELDALGSSDKTFLIDSLLHAVHQHRMQEASRETLKHVLVLEEAHHLLLRKSVDLTGTESVMDVIFREIRELGEAIVLLDQVPSMVSRPALANCFGIAAFNMREKSDVTAASKAMLLEPDEAKYLGHLPVGWGIVKLQARWTKPFLVSFPQFGVAKGSVTNARVHEQWKARNSIETIAGLAKAMLDGVHALAVEKFPIARNQAAPAASDSDDELRLLQDVGDQVLSPVSERWQRLGWRPADGTAMANGLIASGRLAATTIRYGSATTRFFALTDSGRQALGLAPLSGRRGGPEHQLWIELLARDLRGFGLDVEVEAPLGGGKQVDLLVRRGEQRLAVEVETGESDWQENVRKCRAVGLEVVLAVTRKDALQQIAAASDARVVLARDAAGIVRSVLDVGVNRKDVAS